jgi:hypothetical protein
MALFSLAHAGLRFKGSAGGGGKASEVENGVSLDALIRSIILPFC